MGCMAFPGCPAAVGCSAPTSGPALTGRPCLTRNRPAGTAGSAVTRTSTGPALPSRAPESATWLW